MKTPLFWIDMEMTGLDEMRDSILEVAVVITDLDFNVIESFHRVVLQPQPVLDGMNDWCKKTHGDSGLAQACLTGTPLSIVEKELLELIQRHYPSNARVVLVGNSVGNDRKFVDRYLPEVSKRLHYRLIDVSSFKEIFREKYSIQFKKSDKHRAVDDILESIHELKHYLSFVSVPQNP